MTGERDATQADELIRALCEVRDKAIRRLDWLENRGSPVEAAALRRDVNEAQTHINRLQFRYLGADASVLNRSGNRPLRGQLGRI